MNRPRRRTESGDGLASATRLARVSAFTLIELLVVIAIVTAIVVVLAGTGIYEGRQAAQLRNRVQALQEEQAPLAGKVRQLQADNARLSNVAFQTVSPRVAMSPPPNELLRARGEVGRLRRELETQGQKKDQEIAALRRQAGRHDIWQDLTNFAPGLSWTFPSLPNIREGATRAEVQAELKNNGATISWQDENGIIAEFPSANSNEPPDLLHFVFANGKLDRIRP